MDFSIDRLIEMYAYSNHNNPNQTSVMNFSIIYISVSHDYPLLLVQAAYVTLKDKSKIDLYQHISKIVHIVFHGNIISRLLVTRNTS